MKSKSKLRITWSVIVGLIYVAVVICIVGMAKSPFETIVLAGLAQLYAAVLYNFSIIGSAADINNYAGFVRFRMLAHAQGLTENEDGLFVEQERNLKEILEDNSIIIVISRVSNGLVSLFAMYKIVTTILLGS